MSVSMSTLVLWLACVGFLIGLTQAADNSGSFPLTRKIDENTYFASIHPFSDEWKNVVNETNLAPAPLNFWFRCIDRKVGMDDNGTDSMIPQTIYTFVYYVKSLKLIHCPTYF